MNMHILESQRAAIDIRKRLMSGVPKQATATDYANEIDALKSQIEKLSNRNVVYAKKRDEEINERIKRLELDLADAHASILRQAKMLSDLMPSESVEPEGKRSVKDIIEEVLQNFDGITFEDIRSVRRTRSLVEPRKACIIAVYNERKDLSSPQIGRIFQRDHTTILHAVGVINKDKHGKYIKRASEAI